LWVTPDIVAALRKVADGLEARRAEMPAPPPVLPTVAGLPASQKVKLAATAAANPSWVPSQSPKWRMAAQCGEALAGLRSEDEMHVAFRDQRKPGEVSLDHRVIPVQCAPSDSP
jgi:hypothetical protein